MPRQSCCWEYVLPMWQQQYSMYRMAHSLYWHYRRPAVAVAAAAAAPVIMVVVVSTVAASDSRAEAAC